MEKEYLERFNEKSESSRETDIYIYIYIYNVEVQKEIAKHSKKICSICFLHEFKVLCAFNNFVVKLNTIYYIIFFFFSAFFPYALPQSLSLSIYLSSLFLSHSLACCSFSMSLSLSHTHTHTLSLPLSHSFTVSFPLVSSHFLNTFFFKLFVPF